MAEVVRRHKLLAVLPTIILVGLSLGYALSRIPGLSDSVRERRNQQDTVWDRKNLSTAALGIAEDRPLLGVGWGRFTEESQDYFRLSPDFPLTANRGIIHNVFLTYAAEIGLIGFGLWLVALILGMARAMRPSPNPDALPWRVGVGAYFVFFLVISNFVFAQVFPNDIFGSWRARPLAQGALPSGSSR